MKAWTGVEAEFQALLTLALYAGQQTASRLGRFIHWLSPSHYPNYRNTLSPYLLSINTTIVTDILYGHQIWSLTFRADI